MEKNVYDTEKQKNFEVLAVPGNTNYVVNNNQFEEMKTGNKKLKNILFLAKEFEKNNQNSGSKRKILLKK